MKKIVISCLIFVVILCFAGITVVNSRKKDVDEFIVYIDPGHGGMDGGALSSSGVVEDETVLQISLFLKEYLEEIGVKVYLTRDGDYDLAQDELNRKRADIHKRVALINESDCDIYVSIHLNAIGSSVWRGAQVFYNDSKEENVILANIIQEYFVSTLRNTNRVAKKIDGVYLVEHTEKVGVLVEAGFLSNEEECALLNDPDYQRKVAFVMYMGILEYMSIMN